MNIQIIHREDLITTMEMESNPFKEGDVINLDVENHDKNFWNVNEVRLKTYKVRKVEYFINQMYLPNKKHILLSTACVTVKEIPFK